jgi:hypothetical protein
MVESCLQWDLAPLPTVPTHKAMVSSCEEIGLQIGMGGLAFQESHEDIHGDIFR